MYFYINIENGNDPKAQRQKINSLSLGHKQTFQKCIECITDFVVFV